MWRAAKPSPLPEAVHIFSRAISPAILVGSECPSSK